MTENPLRTLPEHTRSTAGLVRCRWSGLTVADPYWCVCENPETGIDPKESR